MQINLNFTNPELISSENEPNVARIYFIKPQMFARKSDYIQIDEETSVEIELLPQVAPDMYSTFQGLADTTVKSSSILMVILSLIQTGALNQILAQISSLSILTHLLLVQVQLTGQVIIFYSKIFEIVKFDVLEDVLHFDWLVK